MVGTKVKLMLGFTVVFLLSSILFANSLNFVDAAPPPDKDKKEKNEKKKYPYTEAAAECREGYWWLVIYEIIGPKEKVAIIALQFEDEKCDPDTDPPKVDGPGIVLKDGAPDQGATYTPPAFDASNSQVETKGDLTVTALPKVLAPVKKEFIIKTNLKNIRLDESIQIFAIPLVPDKVTLLQIRPSGQYQLFQDTTMEIEHEWRCEEPVSDARYGFTFYVFPTSLLNLKSLKDARASALPFTVVSSITCLESVDQAAGVQLGTSEDTVIIFNPEPSQTSETPSEEEKPKGKGPKGVEQQGIITASGNYLPPVKQMKMGITAEEVTCNEGKELIFKSSDGSPKCVSSIAAEKLVGRGWATR